MYRYMVRDVITCSRSDLVWPIETPDNSLARS